jgi:hypothetical protein
MMNSRSPPTVATEWRLIEIFAVCALNYDEVAPVARPSYWPNIALLVDQLNRIRRVE